MMRGTPGMRLAFAIMSPIFLLLCVVAIRSEETRPWMRYQQQFKQMYVERAGAELQKAEASNDERAKARWQRIVEELSRSQPEIEQIYLEDLKVADRCGTCHLGIDNPLFKDAPEPFRTHPGDVLKHHDVSDFACTPCHQGQGAATTVEGAHGHEENWLNPLLPTGYVQAGCARCHEVTHGVKGADLVSRGADLFMEMGCYGCHDVKGLSYLPKYGPPLTPIQAKLTDAKSWAYAWVKDPTKMSPDTAMPSFDLKDEDLGKIMAFVLSLKTDKSYEPVSLGGASAEDGEKLFTERGCRGCHAVEADEHSSSPRVPHLAGIGSKVTQEWLDAWIKDPKQYNKDTAMPKLELTDEERHALVAYLSGLKRKEEMPAVPDLSQFDVQEGKDLFKKYECWGCHEAEGFEKARPSVPDLGEFARKPINEVDFANTTDVPRTKWDWLKRKLHEPRAFETDKIKLLMPTHKIKEDEEQALITYVVGLDAPTLPARYMMKATDGQKAWREASWMVAHLGCNACHPLFGKEPRIAKFFERKSRVPPTLEGVGARLQGQYMYQFVLEPKQVRPWLKMRMPTFGFTEAQARTLVAGFAAMAEVTNPYTYVAKTNVVQERFDRGIRRFRHYKCVQCHPTSIDQGLPPDLDPDDLSINLMLTKERLRPEWIKDFMTRPKEIAGTDTRMPTVFYTVDGVPKVERPKDDIDDITTYMMAMVEPPEETVAAAEARIEAEEAKEQAMDWTTFEY